MTAGSAKAKLIASVGAASAALLFAYVPQVEGTILRGYRDPIGIVTACTGHTATAVLGRAYTPEECAELLASDLQKHADGVLKCTPRLAEPRYTYQRAAAISFAFNVGVGAYCGSTSAKRFQAGDMWGACKALNESDSGRPQWVTAKGVPLPGLVKRRATERAMCETGLIL